MKNNIKKIRKEKGLTQIEVAEKLNTSQSNLSGWEKDKWQPDFETIKKLCSIFNCSADYLIGITNYEVTPTKTEPIEEQTTEEQQILIEKIKILDNLQLQQVKSFVDKIISLDKEQEQLIKNLLAEKYKNKESN